MANTDQDRAMCSNTRQTQKHENTTQQTRLPGANPDTGEMFPQHATGEMFSHYAEVRCFLNM